MGGSKASYISARGDVRGSGIVLNQLSVYVMACKNMHVCMALTYSIHRAVCTTSKYTGTVNLFPPAYLTC